MGKKTKEHWGKFCADWNAKHPVGASVFLAKDNGTEVATKTRSEAYVCDSGYPVVFLEGIAGYYLMDRVRAAVSESGDQV